MIAIPHVIVAIIRVYRCQLRKKAAAPMTKLRRSQSLRKRLSKPDDPGGDRQTFSVMPTIGTVRGTKSEGSYPS
jgi:hypothetical protein